MRDIYYLSELIIYDLLTVKTPFAAKSLIWNKCSQFTGIQDAKTETAAVILGLNLS